VPEDSANHAAGGIVRYIVGVWLDITRPGPFTGGTIKRVAVDVGGEPYVDLERAAAAMIARE
jgi:hypothetical protein